VTVEEAKRRPKTSSKTVDKVGKVEKPKKFTPEKFQTWSKVIRTELTEWLKWFGWLGLYLANLS
jgi:hypothetical protein